MGRGNVCVHGPYEGLYFIDTDHFHVYREDDPYSDYPEVRLLGELDYEEQTGDQWIYDEIGSAEELDDIIECFLDDFLRRFPSFHRTTKETWIRNGPGGQYGEMSRRVLAENNLYYICAEDNEWSEAVELIQKEDVYDNHLLGLQAKHYQSYINGIRDALLDRLPSIGTYTGPWTSGTLKKEDVA